MALPCTLKIYVKYFDNFLPPEPIAFQPTFRTEALILVNFYR
jgi:hypothetical protein